MTCVDVIGAVPLLPQVHDTAAAYVLVTHAEMPVIGCTHLATECDDTARALLGRDNITTSRAQHYIIDDTTLQRRRHNSTPSTTQHYNIDDTTLQHRRHNITTSTTQHCNIDDTTSQRRRHNSTPSTTQHHNIDDISLQHRQHNITPSLMATGGASLAGTAPISAVFAANEAVVSQC